jgi:hypothetical protein
LDISGQVERLPFKERLVQSYYLLYLHRAADAGAVPYYGNAMVNGMTDQAVAAILIGSAEYFNRL